MEKERILCAAIWYKEWSLATYFPTNIDRGVVLCGYRHGSIISQCMSLLNKPQSKMGENVQGFLTSYNRFVDRKEAREIHLSNGQQSMFSDQLYSEDLY